MRVCADTQMGQKNVTLPSREMLIVRLEFNFRCSSGLSSPFLFLLTQFPLARSTDVEQ